jgi:hypothetical protein
MTPMLYPEMAQSAFQPLLGRLQGNGAPGKYSPDEVRELIIASAFGAAILEKFWETLQASLRRGIERSKLKHTLQELSQVADIARQQVFAKIVDVAKGAALPAEERLAGLQTLDGFQKRADLMRKELAALQRLLESTGLPFDPASLNSGAQSSASEGYVAMDEIMAKLRPGGEV